MTLNKEACFYHRETEAVEKCEKCEKLICLKCKKKVTTTSSQYGSTSFTFCPICYLEREYNPNLQLKALLYALIAAGFLILGFVMISFAVLVTQSDYVVTIIGLVVSFIGLCLLVVSIRTYTKKLDPKTKRRREEAIDEFLRTVDPIIASRIRNEREINHYTDQ